MSRQIALVTFFVLISLVLIAATSYGVRGWLGGTHEAVGGQSRILNVQATLNQGSTGAGLENLSQPGGAHQEGGCHSDAVSSSDY
jgi:hypothetical protein